MIRFANMRKFLIASISVLFLAISCTTKFNVGADYKEVTVVYGLLSLADTAHYIKITKGYFDQKQNNLELAKNPDLTTEVKYGSFFGGGGLTITW